MKTYLRFNRQANKWLWGLVILGILASLFIAYDRNRMELNSGRNAEFVFDYRDLLEIADLQTDPYQFVQEHLYKIKQSGIPSLAIYESTLQELQLSRRIELYSSHELRESGRINVPLNENYTYVLFADEQTEVALRPLLTEAYKTWQVQTRGWNGLGRPGLIIEMSMDKAAMKPMDPDPITMDMLKEHGFQLVVRLSNRRTFNEAHMDELLGRLSGDYGVKMLLIDGETVPGFDGNGERDHLDQMGELLVKHGIGLAVIEMQKAPQRGFNYLAQAIDYNVVRLHSFTESDGQKLTENLTNDELEGRIQGATDRLVLAVKDRNIRMIFLNARAVKNTDRGLLLDPLDSLYKAVSGEGGAMQQIERIGYSLGTAERFDASSVWKTPAKVLVWLGAVAIIALLASLFVQEVTLLLFIVGMIGTAGLYVLSSSTFAQALALGASASAPTIAVILAIQTVSKRRKEGKKSSPGIGIAVATTLLLRTTALSLIGACFIVGLLDHMTYSLVIEQFRGVSVLHYGPVVLVAAYWLLFHDRTSLQDVFSRARTHLSRQISVLWVIVTALLVAIGYYYLSRTGNEGQVTGVERLFRTYLENTIGVRPRFKEFLLMHPLFILGAYLCLKYRNAALLLVGAVVGQASIVDTFAHLHTPLVISSLRVAYGLGLGIIIGLLLIIFWEMITRSWRRWVLK